MPIKSQSTLRKGNLSCKCYTQLLSPKHCAWFRPREPPCLSLRLAHSQQNVRENRFSFFHVNTKREKKRRQRRQERLAATIVGARQGQEALLLKRTYRQQQRTTLFDSSDAAEAANHHDDGSHRDEQVGCGQRGKRWWQGGEASLGHREPHSHAQDATSAQLQGRKGNTRRIRAPRLD